MRKFLIVLSFTFLSISINGQSKNTGENLDKYLSARTDLGRFSGAVLIAKNDEIILRKGYGFASIERKIPYTPETKHKIASISKMFTAMAILKLREKEKLNLEDSVCKNIENCPSLWKPVTIENLLRHTSGIPNLEDKLGEESYAEFTRQENLSDKIFEKAKEFPLDFKPGEKFNYSNTGYVLLEHIIEKVSGENFINFVEKEILKPAGMKNTGYFDAEKPPKDLAAGYTHGNLGWKKTLAGFLLTDGVLDKQPHSAYNAAPGSGGLYSTIDDLHRWSKVMNGKTDFASEKLTSEIFDPKGGRYGYGWFVESDGKEFSHNGIIPGYISYFAKFPKENLTIILFSNLDRVRLSTIIRDLSLIAQGKSFDMPVHGKVIELTEDQITRLVGEYKMSDGRLLTVSKEPEFLTAKLEDRFTAGLIPLSPTEFYFPLADGKVIFTIGGNGKSEKVNLRYGGRDRIAVRD